VRLGDKITISQNVYCSKRWISPSGKERYVLGAEDGIYVGKRGGLEKTLDFELVTQIEFIENPPLFLAVGGKIKHVKVWPSSVLDGGPGWPITLDITMNCTHAALGKIDDAIVLAVSTAKRRIVLLKVDSTKRFKKIKELGLADTCSSLKFFKDRLCAGYSNKFKVFDLKRLSESNDTEYPSKSDAGLSWILNTQSLVPMAIFKFKSEYLLCYNCTVCLFVLFSSLFLTLFSMLAVGVFVNESGKQCRKTEFKWISTPLSFGLMHSRLVVYNADFVEVFSLDDGEKLENIPLQAIAAVDAVANLLVARGIVYSLRYVGNAVMDEISDESVLVDGGSSVFNPAAVEEPSSWTRSDSLFLKNAIAEADLEYVFSRLGSFSA